MAKYRCPICDSVKTRTPSEVDGKQKVYCKGCDIWFSAKTSKEDDGPIKAKMYAHGSKDSNWEKGEELGLSEEAMEKFCYAFYEVEFDVQIDQDTGVVMIHAVNGMELREPVKG